ncbi:MAG: hypothetical protein ACOCRX_00965 [Candidatus Woesearchaeota archaeon]
MNIKEIRRKVKSYINFNLKQSKQKYIKEEILGVNEGILEKISQHIAKDWINLGKERFLMYFNRLKKENEYEFKVLELLLVCNLYELSKKKDKSWMESYIKTYIEHLKSSRYQSTEYEIRLFRKLKRVVNLEKKKTKEESKLEKVSPKIKNFSKRCI